MTQKIKLRFFLDSEFNEAAARFAIDPISIALVPEDRSRENFYAVSSEFDAAKITPWLEENVIRHLPAPAERMSNDDIRDKIIGYVSGFKAEGAEVSSVEIWAYNGSTDNVVMANFFGGLTGLRKAFNEAGLPSPEFRDMKELTRATGKKLPPPENAHDCLVDALWTRDLFEHQVPLLKKGQKFLVR